MASLKKKKKDIVVVNNVEEADSSTINHLDVYQNNPMIEKVKISSRAIKIVKHESQIVSYNGPRIN